nr:hypothetical protein K-LCC10_0355 [Kaumoebavirus]
MSRLHCIGTIPTTTIQGVQHILLGLRPETNDWDWLGGKTEGNERAFQTYSRELVEEAGTSLMNDIVENTDFINRYKITIPEGQIHVVRSHLLANVDITPHGVHTQYKWFSREEVEKAFKEKSPLDGYPLRGYLVKLFANEGFLEFL